MGKNRRTCCHSRYRVRLALLARHITRMDCSGHRVFQRSTQVPLPDSLFSCGTRHHPVYPGFYGLLKPDGMGYIQTLPLQGKRAVRSRAALFMSATIQKTRRTGMEDTDIDTPMNYRAKLADASCRTARSGLRFRKNHPRCAPVFSPKTLPFRKHPPSGPCSSTGCQSPSIHIKIIKLCDKQSSQDNRHRLR